MSYLKVCRAFGEGLTKSGIIELVTTIRKNFKKVSRVDGKGLGNNWFIIFL